MTRRTLVASSLRHYWRTNAAVVFGIGVAVSALAGALVVGDSVRSSLRDLALSRLGGAEQVITASHLFTVQLADRLSSAPELARSGVAPLLALEGFVVHERSGSRAGAVQVYGVDHRFWTLHGLGSIAGPVGRETFLSPALARELGAADGDALLLRVQKPSTIPAGLIQARRDDPGRAIRLSLKRVLDRASLGDFSLRPDQTATRAIFVPLDRLQRDLELPARVNTLLVGSESQIRAAAPNHDPERLQKLIERHADLADLGIRLRTVGDRSLAVESDAGLLTPAVEKAAAAAARDLGVEPVPVLTYLATGIKVAGRETPYSLVAALPHDRIAESTLPHGERPIWLSAWTAEDLGARLGDPVTLEYFVWSDESGLSTAAWDFTVAGILPMTGIAVDPDLTPEYPGISTSRDITDWDPPFPVDLAKIRPKDEAYWDAHRTAPKAFIRIEDGQAIWQSRYGSVSSLRLMAPSRSAAELEAAYRNALASQLTTRAVDFRVIPVRENALAAAAGTTDFGEYFTYFSFFVVISSLLLALLFFRLGIEQRAREVGLLAALGFTPRQIRRNLLGEGLVLATAGAAIGVAGAIAYAWLIMTALRTWWIDAVGTTDLALHLSPVPLIVGGLAGIAAGLVFIAWSLRVLRRASARQLMSGAWVDAGHAHAAAVGTRTRAAAFGAAFLAVLLMAIGFAGAIPATGAFFGSGSLLLVAGLCSLAAWLRGTSRHALVEQRWPLARLGLRNARYRPARSVLSAALIAAATFLIVSVGAFRRGAEDVGDQRSTSGGYALIAETVSPLMHDPATPEGREALSLGPDFDGVTIDRFRLRPGDDASCLNLYRPQSPRLLGATNAFMRANRFTFADSTAASEEEQLNPWRLLNRRFDDGAVPVIGDATSLAYVFHLGVGDDFTMQGPDGRPLKLRIVGALRDSVLQSELIMSEGQFTRLFPRIEGFRVFLVAADPSRAAGVSAALEAQLQDFGMDAQPTGERLASYHRVENTFLTTFQALGGLGLVLGTLGLGAVLLRNVLERRRELALLQAAGYRRAHLARLVIAESLFLLTCGLLLGVISAAIGIAPAYVERGQPFPLLSTAALLAAVLAAGLLSTVMATRAVATMPLLESLKNE
jgi:putative ABC transport system permease protein